MIQENKELLLKDLCARLPYGVKCHVPTEGKVMTLTGKRLNYFCFHDETWNVDYNHEYEVVLDPLNDAHNGYIIKPYLRPMSSMTEEEANELDAISDGRLIGGGEYLGVLSQHYWTDSFKYILLGINWLNAHHFDYRGLIEKGLALEAPEGMYNLKEK